MAPAEGRRKDGSKCGWVIHKIISILMDFYIRAFGGSLWMEKWKSLQLQIWIKTNLIFEFNLLFQFPTLNFFEVLFSVKFKYLKELKSFFLCTIFDKLTLFYRYGTNNMSISSDRPQLNVVTYLMPGVSNAYLCNCTNIWVEYLNET